MDEKKETARAISEHQKIVVEYSAIRKNLPPRDQYFFDKAINLLEELAEEEAISERALVLSCGVMAGMCAAKMSRREYCIMSIGMGSAVIKAKLVGDMERRANGGSNSD